MSDPLSLEAAVGYARVFARNVAETEEQVHRLSVPWAVGYQLSEMQLGALS